MSLSGKTNAEDEAGKTAYAEMRLAIRALQDEVKALREAVKWTSGSR